MASDEPPWVHGEQGDRSAQVIQIDNGKHVAAVAICAVVCGICVCGSWWMQNAFRNDAIDIQDQYQKERNHVIELEARLHSLVDEVQEMKHERR